MDRYRLMGMEYRFHDDAAGPAHQDGAAAAVERAPDSSDQPRARAPDAGSPEDDEGAQP